MWSAVDNSINCKTFMNMVVILHSENWQRIAYLEGGYYKQGMCVMKVHTRNVLNSYSGNPGTLQLCLEWRAGGVAYLPSFRWIKR